MEPNPYSPGARPAYLAGRRVELETVRERMQQMKLLGRSSGPLLAFYGPRGFGKTSLLRQAQVEANNSQFLTAWVTGRAEPMVTALSRSLSTSIRAHAFGEPATGILHRLDQVQVEFGLPGFKVSAQVATPTSPEQPAAPTASRVVGELLEDSARFAANHGLAGLVLFVDEFHEALRPDRTSLLIAMQEFDGEPPCPAAIVAAGLPSIHNAVTEAATFGERTQFIEMAGLNDVAVAEALIGPAADRDVAWAPDALEEAIASSMGYPHLVQLIGHSTWEAARPERNDTITVAHVRLGAEQAQARMVELFNSRWDRATTEQRRLLCAIAAGGDDAATRADIAARLGRTPKAISRPRDELIDRGLVQPAGHGRLQFTVPGFGKYLREHRATEVADLAETTGHATAALGASPAAGAGEMTPTALAAQRAAAHARPSIAGTTAAPDRPISPPTPPTPDRGPGQGRGDGPGRRR